jgi:hypothetical protein
VRGPGFHPSKKKKGGGGERKGGRKGGRKEERDGCWWLTPVILATQEAKIKRITVQTQIRQIVPKTLYQKTHHNKRAGGVVQGEGPEFKPQQCKKKERKEGGREGSKKRERNKEERKKEKKT